MSFSASVIAKVFKYVSEFLLANFRYFKDFPFYNISKISYFLSTKTSSVEISESVSNLQVNLDDTLPLVWLEYLQLVLLI